MSPSHCRSLHLCHVYQKPEILHVTICCILSYQCSICYPVPVWEQIHVELSPWNIGNILNSDKQHTRSIERAPSQHLSSRQVYKVRGWVASADEVEGGGGGVGPEEVRLVAGGDDAYWDYCAGVESFKSKCSIHQLPSNKRQEIPHTTITLHHATNTHSLLQQRRHTNTPIPSLTQCQSQSEDASWLTLNT